MNDLKLANKLGLDKPKTLVENRVSFAGPHSELSIYDTYRQKMCCYILLAYFIAE